MPVDDFKAQLEAIRQLFLAELPKRIARLEDALQRAQQSPNEEALCEARALAHSLSGSGGTFGAAAISTSAKALEDALSLSLLAESPRNDLHSLFMALKSAVDTAQATEDSSGK